MKYSFRVFLLADCIEGLQFFLDTERSEAIAYILTICKKECCTGISCTFVISRKPKFLQRKWKRGACELPFVFFENLHDERSLTVIFMVRIGQWEEVAKEVYYKL